MKAVIPSTGRRPSLPIVPGNPDRGVRWAVVFADAVRRAVEHHRALVAEVELDPLAGDPRLGLRIFATSSVLVIVALLCTLNYAA